MAKKLFPLKSLVWAALISAPVWGAYHLAARDTDAIADQKGSSMAIKVAPARAEAMIPILDAQAPQSFQTATFALG
jgi:hypothetical protein